MSAGATRVAALDVAESAADVPTEAGITRFRRNGGVLQQASAGGSWVPYAGGITVDSIRANGIDDDTTALRNLLASAGPGAKLMLPSGDIRLTANVPFAVGAHGVSLLGSAAGATRLLWDAAYTGDELSLQNTYRCRVADLSIASPSQRSAGNAIVVSGGNPNVLLAVSYPLSANQTTIERVDMELQFGGLTVQNDAGPPFATPWGIQVSDGRWQCSGGYGLDLNATTAPGSAKFGATHRFKDIFVYANPTQVSTGAGFRVRGTGDARFDNCDTFGLLRGLQMDPAAQGWVTTVRFTKCFFDLSQSSVAYIAPDAAITAFGDIAFAECWFATSMTEHGLYLATAKAGNIRVENCGFLNNAIYGMVLAAGCNNVSVGAKSVFSSNHVGGLIATGSSTHFTVTDSLFCGDYGVGVATAQPLGIQVDAGCDHYIVTNNDLAQCATPKTITPVDAASRRISTGNIEA